MKDKRVFRALTVDLAMAHDALCRARYVGKMNGIKPLIVKVDKALDALGSVQDELK